MLSAHRTGAGTIAALTAVMATVAGLAVVLSGPAAASDPVRGAVPATARVTTQPAGPTVHALNAVAGCGGPVALGATSTCDFPAAGGTTRYRVHVSGADTIRMRTAVPAGGTPTVTLSKSDGTALCSQFTSSQGECAVPGAGNYLVDVTLGGAATAYTTIDSVRTPGSCNPTIDDRVNRPGTDIDVPNPGSSWCALVPAATSDVLQAELDSNDDDLLRVTVYDDTGTPGCTMSVTAYAQSECTLSGGSGFRLFGTFDDDTADSTVLFLSDVSNPQGCVDGAPDDFGTAPSRSGTVLPHRSRCYTFAEPAGHHIGVHALGNQDGRDLSWRVRSAAGQTLCSATLAQATPTITNCAIPADGSYTLFVYSRGSRSVHYAISLTDLTSSSGCAPVLSTAWGHAPTAGSVSDQDAVACHSFAGATGHRMRMAVDGGSLARGLLVDTSGASVCAFMNRQDCALPSAGVYRVLVSSAWPSSVTYRLWATDTDSTQGCTPTTADPLGAAPTRTGHLTADVTAACWSFTGPAHASYVVREYATSGTVLARWEMRSIGTAGPCTALSDVPGPCRLGAAGTYLLIASPYSDGFDAAQTGDVVVGFWRVDRVSKCPTLGTSFAAAATGATLAAPLQANCTQFQASRGDQILVRTESDPSTVVTHMIVDSSGSRTCWLSVGNCALTGTGPYRVISYARDATTTGYRFRVASLTKHLGCLSLAATVFGHAPSRRLALDGGSDVACYRVTPAAIGQLGLRLVQLDHPDANTRLSVFRTDGGPSCSTTTDFQTCPMTQSGPFLLVAYADAPVSGQLGWLDLTSSTGCDTAASLDFGAPATPSRIIRRGVVGCTSVPTGASDWARLVFAVAGSGADLRGRFVDGRGATVCELSSAAVGVAVTCRPGASRPGPYRVLVWTGEDGVAFDAVSRLHVWRANNPSGCVDGGTFGTGFGPLVGTLPDPNDETCYLFRGRPGQLSLSTSNDDAPDELPRVQIMAANGTVVCVAEGSGTCTLPATGTYSLLVMRGFSTTTFTGHYRINGVCTSQSCGPATVGRH